MRRLLLFALLLTGCPTEPAPLGNTAPSAVIATPDGQTIWTGESLEITGGVADAETSADQLETAWVSSIDGVLGSGTNDAGSVSILFVPQTAGLHAISLTATDPDGAAATASISVQVNANTGPTIVLQEPTAGEDYLAADPITVRAVVADDDDDLSELEVTFSSDVGGPLSGLAGPDAAGTVQWTGTLVAGTHTITARVTDPAGAQDEDSVTIAVAASNDPPTCSVAIPGLGVYNDTDVVPLMGQVGDTEDAPETLDILWESSIDGTVDTTPASSTGELNGSATNLTPGNHTFMLTVTDSSGLTCTNEDLQLTINGTPSAPVVAIEPAAPTATDDLELVTVTPAMDPDGDTLTTSIVWLRDGVAQAAWAGQTTVLSADTNSGEIWTVEVTVMDATASASAAPVSVTIGNGAPSVTAPIIGPTLLYTNTEATCTVGSTSDPEGDTVTVDTSWEVDGVVVAGQTGLTLDGASFFEKDQTVACISTPDDGTSTGTPQSSIVLTVLNSSPTAPVLGVTPAIASPDVGLTCLVNTPASDPDAADVAGLTLSYSWLVDGGSAGITDPIVPSSATSAGESWTCQVTAEDDDGATSPVATAGAVICTPETWYEDFDGDGFGNLNSSQTVCPPPGAGWVQDNTDCNDLDINIFPFAGDSVGGPDEDCDGEDDCEAGYYLGTYFALCLPPGNGNQADAHAECQSLGYDGLASVRSQQEQDYLWLLFQATGQQSSTAAWIGLTDEIVEGSFGWLDGSPLSYTNWAGGEPNNAGNEDCVELNFPLGFGTWNDLPCTNTLSGFVCQLR